MATLSQKYSNKETRGGIAVNKTYMVPLDELYVEDGYNIREIDQEHVIEFADAWCDGEYLPAMTVEVTERGVKIIDGHHRYHGALIAKSRGHEVARVECKDFVGSESDKIAYMVTSSQGKQLSAIERANAYLRLKNQGWTNDEIAKKVKRSVSDIATHLSLAECGDTIKKMVKDGEMSYATAVDVQRKHGVDAESVAVEQLEKAKAEGKTKVTKKTNEPQFSAKKARRLVELMTQAKLSEELHEDAEILMPISAWKEASEIINEYLKGE